MAGKLIVILILVPILAASGCTKKPVRAGRPLNGSAVYSKNPDSVKPGQRKNVNLVRSAGNALQNLFSGFNGKGAPIKMSRSQVMVFLVILGGVLLTAMVYFQNRPKKNRPTKGKHRI